MVKYIVLVLLILFLIYMIIWSLKLNSHEKHQNKVKRAKELRAKVEENAQTIDVSRTYWFNRKEAESYGEGQDVSSCFHYFDSVDEGVHDLLIEMYDWGIVRTDELEKIAYGEDNSSNVDLSFLQKIDDDVLTVQGMDGVVGAAKELDEKDPGIMDIHGTLSDGVEKVLEAVDKEKELEDQKNEPIVLQEEVSVEKARSNREKASTQEVRNQIYNKWISFVEQLYGMIEISADEETKNKIGKGLAQYGNNDVDVLLKSPE